MGRRKCSHCGNVGHNSRTCTARKGRNNLRRFKLFGVQLLQDQTAIKKSFSMDYLPSSSSSSSSYSSSSRIMEDNSVKFSSGYLSDGILTKTQERKKGVPWSEEEHRVFLIGLEKLGKGDWRGISKKFVTTRTPTQVASHAQKYFLRLNSFNKRKQLRPSLFDVARDKFTVQVVESSSKADSDISNKPYFHCGISSNNKRALRHSSDLISDYHYNSIPIWFNHKSNSNSTIHQFPKYKMTTFNQKQQPDSLQLSLSLTTPSPLIEPPTTDPSRTSSRKMTIEAISVT